MNFPKRTHTHLIMRLEGTVLGYEAGQNEVIQKVPLSAKSRDCNLKDKVPEQAGTLRGESGNGLRVT